ncbi:hypothetical protein [Sphaerisporangium album]|uniref:hypothetical protein n=1 Tax=Sphaerisporangium album TaxID=509200 RepID=UPI0015F01A50|nr:hypothetical protein [Sphaerisporangium album]
MRQRSVHQDPGDRKLRRGHRGPLGRRTSGGSVRALPPHGGERQQSPDVLSGHGSPVLGGHTNTATGPGTNSVAGRHSSTVHGRHTSPTTGRHISTVLGGHASLATGRHATLVVGVPRDPYPRAHLVPNIPSRPRRTTAAVRPSTTSRPSPLGLRA